MFLSLLHYFHSLSLSLCFVFYLSLSLSLSLCFVSPLSLFFFISLSLSLSVLFPPSLCFVFFISLSLSLFCFPPLSVLFFYLPLSLSLSLSSISSVSQFLPPLALCLSFFYLYVSLYIFLFLSFYLCAVSHSSLSFSVSLLFLCEYVSLPSVFLTLSLSLSIIRSVFPSHSTLSLFYFFCVVSLFLSLFSFAVSQFSPKLHSVSLFIIPPPSLSLLLSLISVVSQFSLPFKVCLSFICSLCHYLPFLISFFCCFACVRVSNLLALYLVFPLISVLSLLTDLFVIIALFHSLSLSLCLCLMSSFSNFTHICISSLICISFSLSLSLSLYLSIYLTMSTFILICFSPHLFDLSIYQSIYLS